MWATAVPSEEDQLKTRWPRFRQSLVQPLKAQTSPCQQNTTRHKVFANSFDRVKNKILKSCNTSVIRMPSSGIILWKYLSCSSCFDEFTEVGHRHSTIYVFSHLVGSEALTASREGFHNRAQTYEKVSGPRFCLYMATVWWHKILHLEKKQVIES